MDIIYSFGDTFYRSSPRDYEKFPIENENRSAQGKAIICITTHLLSIILKQKFPYL